MFNDYLSYKKTNNLVNLERERELTVINSQAMPFKLISLFSLFLVLQKEENFNIQENVLTISL